MAFSLLSLFRWLDVRYTEPPPYQRKVAEACFRFMDSDARFADRELDMLLRGIQDNEKCVGWIILFTHEHPLFRPTPAAKNAMFELA